ncbi:hypothetical protein ACN47E_009718 [Coniothyrium glycines]
MTDTSANTRKRKADDVPPPDVTCLTNDTLPAGAIYDQSNETFPKLPWYDLNYELVTDCNEKMCTALSTPLEQYTHSDEDIKDFVEDIKRLAKMPTIAPLVIALVGSQGSGKSTLINSFLGRMLVQRSGGSGACTSYPTWIKYKEGARDNTCVSDVTIEFLTNEEIKICIREQIVRWEVVYAGNEGGLEGTANADDEGDSDEDHEAKEVTIKKTQIQLKTAGKLSRDIQDSLKTAKEFFEMVCNTKKDATAKTWLENALYKTDIREGDFATQCFAYAQARLQYLRTAWMEMEDRKAKFLDIPDYELTSKITEARRFAPLVKMCLIETGGVILRHGPSFLDLPGFGDTSHFRESVINDYRRKSDFEIVVVSSSRFRTDQRQLRYLDDSIHIKGANNILLVMNQSDRLLDEDSIGYQLGDIESEPFLSLTKRWDEIIQLEFEGEVEHSEISALRRALIRDAYPPFIEYERSMLQEEMNERGVRVCLTSAYAYRQWMERCRASEPLIGPVTSGVPGLRQILFKLPAKANYDAFLHHISTRIPTLRRKADRVLKKHKGSKGYMSMRQDLEQQISLLREELESRVERQIPTLIRRPWTRSEEVDIARSIEDLTSFEWAHPRIQHPGFAKMLRENGIPTDGVYFDLDMNLNRDILGKITRYMDEWFSTLTAAAEQLGNEMEIPVQDLESGLWDRIDISSAEPALMESTSDALFDTSESNASAYNKLLTSLKDSLRTIYTQFTSEIDIHCPIATAMKPVYERVRHPRNVGVGKGIYKRQQKCMRESIMHPQQPDQHHTWLEPLKPLFDTLKEQIVEKLKVAWTNHGNSYTAEVDAHLRGFLATTSALLKKDAHMGEEHKCARRLLRKLLEDFDVTLLDIQSRFTDMDGLPLKKKKKKMTREEPATTPATRLAEPATFDEFTESVPIVQNDAFFDFVNTMWPIGSHDQ